MRISVELVPRSLEALERELAAVKRHLPGVDTVNIPDLLRFKTRSWQACASARRHFAHAIPHLRAIDINLKKPLPIADFLERHDLHEVLVVSGDPPADMGHPVYATSSLQAIKKLRAELPGIKVYAALDPYRQSFVRERDLTLAKLEAGACGLFTQPFFDVRLMEVYAELLPEVEIFWGVTSVTHERSLAYWQNRNRAIFPADFEASMAWSQRLAKRALRFVKQQGGHIYFMPIRASAVSYLQGVLDSREDTA